MRRGACQEKLMSIQGRVVGLAVIAVLAASSAQAQSGTVKAVFEKHKLLGTFAWDCSKPAANNNLYFVHRPLDGGQLQRDQMSGETTRDWTLIIEKATDARPNEITYSGLVTGRLLGRNLENKPVNGVYRIEQNRLLQWEATVDGERTIGGGKILSNGSQVPWASRCGG